MSQNEVSEEKEQDKLMQLEKWEDELTSAGSESTKSSGRRLER